MKAQHSTGLKALLIAGFVLLSGAEALADKTQVCHAPPGNPDNYSIIEVGSDNAKMKHIMHGDWIVEAPKCDEIPDNDCDGTSDDVKAENADCVERNEKGWECHAVDGECIPPTCPCIQVWRDGGGAGPFTDSQPYFFDEYTNGPGLYEIRLRNSDGTWYLYKSIDIEYTECGDIASSDTSEHGEPLKPPFAQAEVDACRSYLQSFLTD